MTAQLPDGLIDYLAARERAREQRTVAALAALTPREQALVCEAAVMGYVQGAMALRRQDIPPDSEVLRRVVASCLAMPDLYPTISRGARQ